MTSETNATAKQASLTDVSLEKEDYHVRSPRIQVSGMTLILLIVCAINYAPTLPVGLLQKDYQRINLIVDATHGQWHEFLQSLQFLDSTNTYKPVSSASLLLDRLIWHSNYAGFHCTNILILFFCATLVMLITLEITGAWGNRSRTSAALWAGLLFAVYPLHAQTVSWLSGRDDLISGLLFLLSLFLFLRFRLIREKKYYRWFLLFFSCLVMQSKSALVLPVVILASIALLPRQLKSVNPKAARQDRLADCYFAISCLLILIACLAYKFKLFETGLDFKGAIAWLQTLGLPTLFDLDSCQRVLLPANMELHWPRALPILSVCPLILAAVTCILRQTKELSLLRSLTFLAGWLLLALLPAWNTYHIYPNLIGSNLFFLASAPFCIAVAIASIPSADVLSRKAANMFTWLGAPSLLLLFFVWSYALQQNLKPFAGAAQIIKQSVLEIHQISAGVLADKSIVILDLPHDYKGAPLLTSESLKLSLEPPFSAQKSAVSVIDTMIGGSSDYVWPDEVKRAVKNAHAFCWSDHKQSFVPLAAVASKSPPEIVDNYLAASLDPPTAWTGLSKDWHLGAPQNPGFETYPTYRRLIPAMAKTGKKAPPAMTMMIPVSNINSFDKTAALIDMHFHGSDVDRQKCHFVWRSKDPGDSQPAVHEATIDKNLVWLGHYKHWMFNSPPTAIGLRLEPGNYCVDVGQMQLLDDASEKPILLVENQVRQPAEILPYASNLKSKLSWQARLKNCKSMMLLISKPDAIATTKSLGTAYSGQEVSRLSNLTKDGTIQLPPLNLPLGLSQIQVIALDEQGQRMGLPSEPVTISR